MGCAAWTRREGCSHASQAPAGGPAGHLRPSPTHPPPSRAHCLRPPPPGTRESRGTYLTLVPIVVGVVLASGGEPEFHLIGFLACLAAAAARALKSVVQAMLLSDANEKLDPMSLLFYMSRWAGAGPLRGRAPQPRFGAEC
jgi:hypothetical protein